MAYYIIVRNGAEIGGGPATTFTDGTTTEEKIYAYQVIAVDAAGNRSAPSAALPLRVSL